ncbi:MAG: hypothetical protein ACJ72W_27205 [Actinoallomurus sp.]
MARRTGGGRALLVTAGLAGGAVAGKRLGDRIPEPRARRLVMLLALVGGLTTLAKGLWELIGA